MKKSTFIRSLLLCGLSMLLCISMLAGSTFAWFTDEVASGNNQIMAGNLDVELTHTNKTVTDQTVEGATELFADVSAGKWEPGAMAWETFTVKNAGTLALKYALSFNVTVPTTGVSLAPALKIAYIEGELTNTTTRINPADYTWQPFSSFALEGKLDLVSATEDTYTLIVWWEPSDNDNAFNMNNDKQGTASVEFSLILKATQVEAEDDSFGNDYDADTVLPVTATKPVNSAADTVIGNDYGKVTIPTGATTATSATLAIEEGTTPAGITVQTGEGAKTYEVSLTDAAGNKITTDAATPVKAELFIGKDLFVSKLYHNEVEIDFDYDPATGYITFETTSFSPFTVITKDEDALEVITTVDALIAAAKAGGPYKLGADLTLSNILVVEKSFTLLGEGHTLTSTAARAINVSGANGVVIKDLTINCTGERAINVIQKATGVTLENVTATAANYTVNVASSAPNAVVAIKNSTLNGLCTVNVAGEGAQVTVDNSIVNCNDNNTTAGEVYAALCLNKDAVGASIIATNTTVNVTAGSDSEKGRNGAEDGTVTINGSIEGVTVTVAAITYPGSDYYYGFKTLAEAIEFAKAGDTITLIRNVVLDKTIKIEKNITIDLNGHNLIAETGSRPFHVYGADLTIDATGSNVELDKYGLVDIKEGDVKITIIGGTFTGELDNGAVIKGRANTKAELYLENVNMTFTDSSAKGSYVYNPDKGASASTVINGGVYNIDCGFIGNVTMKNATVNAKGFIFNGGGSIEKCTLTTDGSSKAPADAAPFCCVAASNDRKVTVTNSTLTATNCNAIEIYPTGGIVTVTGSTVTGACYKHPLYDAQNSCSITIDGVEQ